MKNRQHIPVIPAPHPSTQSSSSPRPPSSPRRMPGSRNCPGSAQSGTGIQCLCFSPSPLFFVIPAQAGIQRFRLLFLNPWIPASAGMTNQNLFVHKNIMPREKRQHIPVIPAPHPSTNLHRHPDPHRHPTSIVTLAHAGVQELSRKCLIRDRNPELFDRPRILHILLRIPVF